MFDTLLIFITIINYSTENLININVRVNQNVSENPLDYISTSETNGQILREQNMTDLQEFMGIAIIDTIITTLQENDVSNLANLRELSLSNTRLQEMLPRCFIKLPNLKYLILEDNRLRKISNGIFANLSLTLLSLKGNELEEIEEEAFENMASLIDLDLAQNRITKLKPEWFRDLVNLENLELSRNKLEILPNLVFASLNKLELLDIANNRIKSLEDNSLSGLHNLNFLNLNDNVLTSVNEKVFTDPRHNLQELYLSGNWLQCKTRKLLQTLLDNIDTLEVDEMKECENGIHNNHDLFVCNKITSFIINEKYFMNRKRHVSIMKMRKSRVIDSHS